MIVGIKPSVFVQKAVGPNILTKFRLSDEGKSIVGGLIILQT